MAECRRYDRPGRVCGHGYSGSCVLDNALPSFEVSAIRFSGPHGKLGAHERSIAQWCDEMKQPQVSVIIVTYNRDSLIADAIQSALAQTYTDFELIVVDDGSQDHTRDVISSFQDSRIRYIYQAKAGPGAGRNAGIAQAQGECICFLDDDDLYPANRLAVMTSFLNQNPDIGWVAGGYRFTDMQGKLLAERRPWISHQEFSVRTWLLDCPPTLTGSAMIRTTWLKQVGGLDPLQTCGEDWDLFLRLAYAGCRMAWIPEIVYVYRLHTTNLTLNSRLLRAETGPVRVLDRFFAQPDLPAELIQLRNTAYAGVFLMRAAASFADKDVTPAVQDLSHALELEPAWVAHEGKEALDALLGYATNPRVRDPWSYLETVFNHLPEQVFNVKTQQRKLRMWRVATDVLFCAAKRQDWSTVRSTFFKVVQYNP